MHQRRPNTNHFPRRIGSLSVEDSGGAFPACYDERMTITFDWYLAFAAAMIVLSLGSLVRAQTGETFPRRFSIRAVLLVTTIVALLLGMIVYVAGR